MSNENVSSVSGRMYKRCRKGVFFYQDFLIQEYKSFGFLDLLESEGGETFADLDTGLDENLLELCLFRFDSINVCLFAKSNVDELGFYKVLVSLIDGFDLASEVHFGSAAEEILVKVEVGIESSSSALVPFLVNLVEVLSDHIANALVIFVAWREYLRKKKLLSLLQIDDLLTYFVWNKVAVYHLIDKSEASRKLADRTVGVKGDHEMICWQLDPVPPLF